MFAHGLDKSPVAAHPKASHADRRGGYCWLAWEVNELPEYAQKLMLKQVGLLAEEIADFYAFFRRMLGRQPPAGELAAGHAEEQPRRDLAASLHPEVDLLSPSIPPLQWLPVLLAFRGLAAVTCPSGYYDSTNGNANNWGCGCSLPAVLEQLHGKVLRSIDEAAYSAGVGARRPLTTLEGWRKAAERTFLGTEPAADK